MVHNLFLSDKLINVYCFQGGDIGAGNLMKFGGNIGPNGAGEGYFCFSEADYKTIQVYGKSANTPEEYEAQKVKTINFTDSINQKIK